MAVGR
jgi:hypothetical protein